MNLRTLTSVAVAAALTTGCAQDAPDAPDAPSAVAVTDSAGVRIVDLGDAPLEVADRRVVVRDPDLVIRSNEDDASYVLCDVRDVEVLPLERVAVVNGCANEILVYDSSGERVAVWGGTGDGPGEFRSLDWLVSLPPDTLAAGERRVRRVTVLDAAGQYVRNVGMASAVDQASNPIPPMAMGLLADGSAIGAFYSQPPAEVGTARPPVEIVAIVPDGGATHPLGTWPGDELALLRQDGLLEVTQPPFGRGLHIAPGPDGVWIADDDRWEARKYSARGEPLMVVRASARPLAVTDELLEAWIAERYRYAREVPTLDDLKQDQREIAQHTTTPSFGEIVGMTNGGVALGDFGLDTASPRRWVTVEPTGTVAAIELPASLDVKRWGPDWVIGVVRDALDREEVHRYRVGPPGAEARR